ncbi:MAG TPA: hypothetical protein VHL11_20065 [Phototrophicaceae bacterium]|jgi:hypothetical protein|nr:hypothetical protein [Phototrophicaceae bacterium]
MTRRRERSTERQREDRRRTRLAKEDRIERITWFLLVLVFAIFNLLPEGNTLPHWLVPLAGGVILLGSGVFQTSNRMKVSPITWIAGASLLFMGLFNIYAPTLDFLGLSLIVFAVVIGFGVVTGET